MGISVPIEVSARHIHLSQMDADILFGEQYEFTPLKALSQTGQYACEEEVEIQPPETYGLPECQAFTFGKRCDRNKVRILGPIRKETQLELAQSDALALGVKAPLVVSGELDHTPGGVILIGPVGQVCLTKGVIIPRRHIHCNSSLAKEKGLQHGEMVSVKVKGERGVIFHNIVIRTDPTFRFQLHLDTDEGNAAGIPMGGVGEIVV